MSTKSRQAVYDQVVTHLRTQGNLSHNENGSSAYRGVNGRRCAMGIFITDDKYDPAIEGNAIESLMAYLPQEIADTGKEFLGSLQRLHDVDVTAFPSGNFYAPDMEKQMRRVADKWALKYTKPTRRV
jgi:hypothetical protein